MPKIDSFLVEQNIISCLLKKPTLVYEVGSQIDKSYFSDDPNRKQNKAIFMILDYISRKKDLDAIEFDSMTILSIAQKFDEVNKALKKIFNSSEEFVKYIETLRESPIDPSNVDIHIEELKKINVANDLSIELECYQDELEDKYNRWDIKDIIEKAESSILKVSNTHNAGRDAFSDEDEDIITRYENSQPNFNKFIGLPMPFDKVNKFSRGLLRKGSVTVINANTGVGKSMALKNVGKFLAVDNDIPVYLGANEQNIHEQEQRIIQEITGIPTVIIENNLYNAPDDFIEVEGRKYNTKKCKNEILSAVKKIQEAPLYFDKISGYTAETLIQRAKYFKKRHNIQVFIWDYVKESTSTSLEDGQLRLWLSNIVRAMKEDIADKLGIAVLTASQAKTYEYWLSGESYGIEKYCTSFCLLRKLDSKERKPMGGEYAFTVKKNRYGKEHPDFRNNWIEMTFDETNLIFKEVN